MCLWNHSKIVKKNSRVSKILHPANLTINSVVLEPRSYNKTIKHFTPQLAGRVFLLSVHVIFASINSNVEVCIIRMLDMHYNVHAGTNYNCMVIESRPCSLSWSVMKKSSFVLYGNKSSVAVKCDFSPISLQVILMIISRSFYS